MRTLLIALGLATVACATSPAEPQRQDSGDVTSVHSRVKRLGQVPPPAPARVDPRTPDQLADAACTGPGGRWLCPGRPAKRLLGAGGSATPPSWSVPKWYVDPRSTSMCASDSNTCTSATCAGTGIGPCRTYTGGPMARWGTSCPQIANIVQVQFLSGHTDATDPVVACAFATGPAYLEIYAVPPPTCTALLSNVTAKNRSTGQLLQAQAAACFTGPDLLVINQTHLSEAWTRSLVSGSIYAISQPADVNVSYASVDTWANGDTVTVGAPIQVNVRNVQTQGSSLIPGFGFNVWIHDVALWDPTSGNGILASSGNGIIYMDEVLQQNTEWYTQGAAFNECDNCDLSGGTEINVSGNIGAESAATFIWGFSHGGINKLGNAAIGGDIILGSSGSGLHYVSGAHIGSVFLDSGAALTARGGDSELTANFESIPTGSAILWGPGAVNTTGSSKLVYPSPATSVFLNTGGLELDGLTTGCAFDTSVDPALWHCGRSVTATLLGTAIGSGGFNGCAWGVHGSRICVQ